MFGHPLARPVLSPVLAVFLWAAVLPGAAPAETPAPAVGAAEGAFLDLLPPLDLPGEIQPIPGARNQAFRDCRTFWPVGYSEAQTGPEARALRDIFSFVAARQVITTEDCGCASKVADWTQVEAIAEALRESHDVGRLTWRETARVSEEARRLIAVAETLCGGAF